MSFAKFNTNTFKYTWDTTNYVKDEDGKNVFKSLEELFDESGRDESKIYVIRAAFIKEETKVGKPSASVGLDCYWANIPTHQTEEVRDIIADKGATEAINNGQAGFRIRPYTKKEFPGETFYSAVWTDVESGDEV